MAKASSTVAKTWKRIEFSVRSLPAIVILFASLAGSASAAPLTFSQGPDGLLPGGPPQAGIGSVANARLTRTDRDDIVVAEVLFPPAPAGKVGLRLFLPQSDGSLVDSTVSLGTPVTAVTHPGDILFKDFNSDGRLDIFVSDGGYDQFPWPGAVDSLVLSSPDGLYRDASAALPQARHAAHSIATADFNEDGNLDLYVGNVYSAGRIGPYILFGNGQGGFTQGGVLPAALGTFDIKFTASLALDVDNDGHVDLMLGSAGEGTPVASESLVLFNDGAGNFTKRSPLLLPPGLFGTTNTINLYYAILDVNRDGYPDALVTQTQRNPSYRGMGIQVLVNNRRGGFTDQTQSYMGNQTTVTGAWVSKLEVLDLNGDGLPDFYAKGIVNGPVTVIAWIDSGDGRYEPVSPDVLGPGTNWMSLMTDVNSDGLPDFISFTSPEGSIYYRTLLNTTPTPSTAGRYSIEFYNESQDHYFVSSLMPDITALDSGRFKGWSRTGAAFKVSPTPAPGLSPVCRFYIPPELGDSHFFSASPAECSEVRSKFPAFVFETPNTFYVGLPDATTGQCGPGLVPIYRVWNDRPGSNHRYLVNKELRDRMKTAGWVSEGYGADQTTMCALQ